MIDLGTLGGPFSAAFPVPSTPAARSWATSITASGEIHAFLWEDGRMIDLGTLGGPLSQAFAINARGQVVGDSSTASGEVPRLPLGGRSHD